MEPGNLLTAVVWSVLPAVVLLGGIWWVDRYEREPLRLLVVALGFGAVAAPVLAVLAQSALDVPTSMASQDLVPRANLNATTPIVEEIARGLAVLAAFLLVRHEVDTLLDGLVYGTVVGVGFGLAANFVSILSTPSLGGDTTPSLFVAMVAGLNHLFYGGVVGVGLAAARRRPPGKIAVAAVIGVVVAAGFHLLHDYLPWWVASSPDGAGGGGLRAVLSDLPNALGLIALAVLSVWAVGREAVLVGRELRDEVQSGVVTADEYATLIDSTKRTGSLLSTLFRRGAEPWRLRRRLYALEVELAFRKHRHRDGLAPSRKLLDEGEYRTRIAETRSRLQAALDGTR